MTKQINDRSSESKVSSTYLTTDDLRAVTAAVTQIPKNAGTW